MSYLVAFDFDYTIIEDNSDTSVVSLAPGKFIPEDIQRLYKKNGWTEYMRQVFKYLHSENVQADDILSVIHNLKLVPGMKSLLTALGNQKLFDVIIISDANSIFIEESLRQHNLYSAINCIFSNPAYFDDSGLLNIKEYHFQNWCSLSSINLCKGEILQSYIKKSKKNYDKVFYAGDGENDFCPMLKLKSTDVALPRKNRNIMRVIDKHKKSDFPHEIQALCQPWKDGFDIINIINTLLDNALHIED